MIVNRSKIDRCADFFIFLYSWKMIKKGDFSLFFYVFRAKRQIAQNVFMGSFKIGLGKVHKKISSA